jgi:hypothetical protein
MKCLVGKALIEFVFKVVEVVVVVVVVGSTEKTIDEDSGTETASRPTAEVETDTAVKRSWTPVDLPPDNSEEADPEEDLIGTIKTTEAVLGIAGATIGGAIVMVSGIEKGVLVEKDLEEETTVPGVSSEE